VFELNGENLGSVAVFNGNTKDISKDGSLAFLAQTINYFSVNSGATNKIPLCDNTYTQVVHQYNDRYEVWTVGTTIITINYVGTTHTTITTVLPYPCDGAVDREALIIQRIGTYSYKDGSNTPNIIPIKIIDELTGKAKCLNALLNKSGDSFVQKLLANFQGKSEFDIKIVSVDKIIVKDGNGNLVESNGETTYNSKINTSLINIAISTSRSDANSSLDAARTILHEYIHADIIRQLYTANNIPETLDFNMIYEKYGSQHGTMAALYLSSMKEALKEFNKTMLPNDYKNYTEYYGEEPSDAFYVALAWSGLKDNNFKAWTDLSAQKKQEINDLAARVTKMSKTIDCP
jgi:hypothetical protein